MSIRKFILFITLVSIFTYSGISQAKEYGCNDLRSLQSKIKKDSKDNAASVAAMIIRFMGRSPNSCVKSIKETANAVEVNYLDRGEIVSDIFNFSKENQLVSMSRTFSNGKTETANF
ncbi:MAG: hypothetical protein AABY64_14390 [Bdellovibrionota bacterium]